MVIKMKKKSKELSHKEGYLQYTPYTDVTQLKRLRLIIERVSTYAQQKEKSELKILELGCGIGSISLPLASLGHQVVGVDIDPKSISSCNSKNTFPNATFIVGDAGTIDLQKKFDIIVSSEVMEHMPQPELILQGLDRHLVEGGIGIVSVPNGYSFFELLISRHIQKGKLVGLLYKSPRLYRLLSGVPAPFYSANISCFHVQFFPFGKFKRLLNRYGFQISLVQHLSLGIFPDWATLWPLKSIECKLADFVPHSLAGGWLFVIKREEG